MKNTLLSKYSNNNKKISFVIALSWILLPVLMTILTVIYYFLGLLPTIEQLISQGMLEVDHYYAITLNLYMLLTNILGIFTILHVAITYLLNTRIIFCIDNIKEKPWFFLFSLYIIWSIFSCILADHPYASLIGEGSLMDGLTTYFIYGAVLILGTLITDNKLRKSLLRTYGIVVIYLSALMIFRETGNEFLAYCFPQWRAVVFEQFNHFGYALCMAFMSFVGLYLYDDKTTKINRFYYLFGVVFITYSLLMNDTFGSYLATLVCLPIIYVIYFIKNKKLSIKSLLPLVIFVLLSLLSYTNNLPCANSLYTNLNQFGTDLGNIVENNEQAASAGTGRMTLWRDTIERIKERPIFGFGPEGLQNEHAITNHDSPHNEYLSMAAFNGIPALLFYLSAIISIAINKFKNLDKQSPYIMVASCIVIVYLASAFFGNAVFNAYPYFMLFLGLVVDDNLVDLSYEKVMAKFSKKEGTKKIIIYCSIIVIIGLVTLFSVSNLIKNKSESSYESADIEAMRLAEITAISNYKGNIIEDNTPYIFDVDNIKLVSSNTSISAYGQGTDITTETEFEYDYDSSTDYSNKVIQVIIKSVNDNPKVELTWIDAN